jgi:hypothetical protein
MKYHVPPENMKVALSTSSSNPKKIKLRLKLQGIFENSTPLQDPPPPHFPNLKTPLRIHPPHLLFSQLPAKRLGRDWTRKRTKLFFITPSTDLPNFCHRGCFFFQVIQTFTQMSAEACQEGLFTCKIAKRPGINTRMCLYITSSEPGAQTLQFHVRPSPSCFSACSKPQSRRACMHAHNKAFVR